MKKQTKITDYYQSKNHVETDTNIEQNGRTPLQLIKKLLSSMLKFTFQ
jgi:hypothetical protein